LILIVLHTECLLIARGERVGVCEKR